jgi:hypothetical protein
LGKQLVPPQHGEVLGPLLNPSRGTETFTSYVRLNLIVSVVSNLGQCIHPFLGRDTRRQNFVLKPPIIPFDQYLVKAMMLFLE